MKKRLPPQTDYEVLSITSHFSIHIEPAPAFAHLSESKKRLIQTIWEHEQKRRGGQLHEGSILSALAFDHKKLSGQFVPYKYFLAQSSDPSLKADLKIRPVSMSGITTIVDNLVIAKRADWVAEYPNFFELAPSGGICPSAEDPSQVDLKEQLLGELADEVGIERSVVAGVKFFALLHEIKSDSIELCADIHLKPCVILSSSREYTQVMSLPTSEMGNFATQHMREFVPLSLEILKLKKMLT